jgi:hypothetical protein
MNRTTALAALFINIAITIVNVSLVAYIFFTHKGGSGRHNKVLDMEIKHCENLFEFARVMFTNLVDIIGNTLNINPETQLRNHSLLRVQSTDYSQVLGALQHLKSRVGDASCVAMLVKVLEYWRLRQDLEIIQSKIEKTNRLIKKIEDCIEVISSK